MKERMENLTIFAFGSLSVSTRRDALSMMNLGGKNRSMVIEPKFGPCDFSHKLELGECTVEGSSRWDWIGWESRNFLRLKICQVLTIKSQIQKTRVWESGDPTHMSSCIWYSGEGSNQTQVLRFKIILLILLLYY